MTPVRPRRRRVQPENHQAIGWIRVSTDKQDAAMQRAKIEQWCTLNGYELLGVYGQEREGLSGTVPLDEAETGQVIEHACRRKATIVTYSLSRISRIVPELYAAAKRITARGANLICLAEGMDLRAMMSTAMGKAFFGFMAISAQLERDLTAERTTAKLQHQRLNGQRAGKVPYGCRVDISRPEIYPPQHPKAGRVHYPHLLRHPDERRALATIFKLHRSGHSYAEIIDELARRGLRPRNGRERWHVTQIQRIVRRT